MNDKITEVIKPKQIPNPPSILDFFRKFIS